MPGTISLESNEVSVGEVDGNVRVTFKRAGDLTGAVKISYGVTADTATAGQDFTGGDSFVIIPDGADRVTISVPILNDALSEPTEAFVVSIVTAENVTDLGAPPLDPPFINAPRTTRVSILDDENPVQDPPDPPTVSNYDVTLQPIASGYRLPIKIEMSPVNPNLAYVAEKGGTIQIANVQTGQKLGTFLDISGIVNDVQDRGLLDIAFHPDFANNHYLYAFFIVDPPDTAGNGGNAGPNGVGNRFAYVERFTASADYMSVVANSGTVILGKNGQSLQDISGAGAIDSTNDFTIASSETVINPNRAGTVVIGGYKQDYIKDDSSSHAGGSLSFGPDGKLYVTIGEGTSFNHADPRAVSVQDVNSLSGKIVRIDPLTGQGLTDNPFYTAGMSLDANAAKVYQLGLRNPFSSGWTPDGRLVVSDTGWNSYEEINIGQPGANFGWPYYEGADGGLLAKTPGYKDLPPAAAFYQQVANGQVVITPAFRAFSHTTSAPGYQVQTITAGSVVYTGNKYPAIFQNDFFFTDFSDGELFTVDANNRQQLTYLYHAPAGKEGPIDYVQGADGYIYYADLVPGVIGRMLIADKGSVNHPPVPGADTLTTALNTAVVTPVAALLANDTDADNNPLTLTAVANATNGSVGLAGGQVTFTPATGFTGAASYQYTVNDGTANATGIVTVNVGGGAPSGLPQLSINGNATKPGADTYQLTVAGNQLGSAMSAVRLDVRQNFTLGFDLNFGANDAGADGMGVVLHNDARGAATVGWGGANLGLMSIANGLGIAFDTYQNANRGDIVNDSASWADTDATTQTARTDLGNVEDGQAKHIVLNWNAATQTLSYTLNGAAIASLTNANFAQTYFGGSNFVYFGFTAATGGGFNTQSVKLTSVAGTFEGGATTNHAPTVVGETLATTTSTALVVTAASLLANDSDVDGDALTLSAVSVAVNGTVGLNAGQVTFTPTTGFNGAGSFQYTVSDGKGGLTNATATVNVAPAAGASPVAVVDTFAATEDTALPVAAARNVLSNDTDADTLAANLTAVLDTTTAHGALVLNANGTFSYTPAANYNGADTFTYHASDGAHASATATVTIDVAPVNDTPVPGADTLTTALNTAVVTPVATLLANDTDVDANPLTLTAVANATNGSVGLTGGQVTFTPATGFTGAASYQYTVNDGTVNATGIVTVNVGAAVVLPQLTISGNATKPGADTYQLTPAAGNQLGSAMSSGRLDVRQNFTLGFDMNFGANDAGADGMGFVLHNDPRGAATIGWGGANLGLMSIVNGLGIAFDTYQNASRGDIVNDSASWADTDAKTQTARIDLGNIEDGQAKHVVVSWNAATQTLSSTLNGAAIASLTNANFAQTYFGGSNFVYFGFTAATGGGFNTQSVKLTDMTGAFNETPVITYNGGADTTLNILENQNILLAHVTATDADANAITYALSGADATKFTISPGGDLRLIAAPDYETPVDAGANNQFVVTVTAKDAANAADTITFTVNVADIAEGAPIQDTAGTNIVTGTAGSDILVGLAGNDTVNAQGGNDTIRATLTDGNDTYNGDAGSDTLDMSAITVAASINLATGAASSAQSGSDVLTAIENALGGSGADTIVGTGAANLLSGGPGADFLTGAGGSDTFVFGPGFGADKITDFGDASGNQDMIDFSGFHFSDVASVLTHVAQVGADTVIDLGSGDVLTLAGVTAVNFGADDLFV